MKTYKVRVSEHTTRYFDVEVQADRIEDLEEKARAVLEADSKLKLDFYNAFDKHGVTTYVSLEDWQEITDEYCS